MIIGAHAIVYSKHADADRAFLRDVLGLPSVDAGEGWLIFRLPPAEVAVHPSEENDRHELYLMTDDVAELVAALETRGIEASRPSQQGWGLLTQVTLPGGGKLGIYQPRHPSPPVHAASASAKGTAGARRTAPARKRMSAKKREPARNRTTARRRRTRSRG